MTKKLVKLTKISSFQNFSQNQMTILDVDLTIPFWEDYQKNSSVYLAICKMISRIVILISKSVFLISNAIIFFDQQELFFWSANFIFLSSRIDILVSKNLNDIKTKFLKGNFTSKCDFFLIRLDFPFPKDKKRIFLLRYPLLTKIKT
jgi:hypothetical protein